MIFDPASCKPIFVALHPPLSSLPTQPQQHVLHLRELHITHSVGNERQIYPSLQQGASCYRLLSASIFLVRAYRPDVSCFAQMSRVSLSFITPCMMTSCDYFFRRQRTSFNRTQPAPWRERLPLGTADHWRGATRLKISVRTPLLLLYFSARQGWPLLDNKRMPIVSFFFGHASKLIYEEGVCSSPRFRICTDISVRIFSKKFKNFS